MAADFGGTIPDSIGVDVVMNNSLRFNVLFGLGLILLMSASRGFGQQSTLPLVAIHDSEFTRALETMPASGGTPTGPGSTGKQWWFPDWRYFVFPEMMKEALRSDGTPFAVLGDSNILSGALLSNGVPRYPILISLAAEAVDDAQIAQFTNYVAAGGYLFVSASGFTRHTNGVGRGDFAFAEQMGIHSLTANINNFERNSKYTRLGNHRLNNHVPTGTLNWRQPNDSEEIPYGIALNPPDPHTDAQAQGFHDYWMVTNSSATVIAQGAALPYLSVKQYGSGYFIYCAALQPLLGHGGWAPTMYNYTTFRRAIEWAFENAGLPIAKVSPWPYPYDAAFMARHDLENYSNLVAQIEVSAQFEHTNGVSGDYYFCTGTLREDMSGPYDTNAVVASLRRAMTNYGATIGPHNGGLTNARIVSTPAAYDHWHWGPDEMLDFTPPGYSSGSNYAYLSLKKSFEDVEGWLPGLMTNGMRVWCSCYYNAVREDSLNIQEALGVKIAGEQKLLPLPHWSLSTRVPGKRFPMLQQPPSDWFVNASISHSLEAGHTIGTMRAGIDYYYAQGFLVNFYSHSLSHGVGKAGAQQTEAILYAMNTNRFPRLWSANAIKIYNWWQQRSNVQISVAHSQTGLVSFVTVNVANAVHTNTTVEVLTPATTLLCDLTVFTNGVLAGPSVYRSTAQVVKVRVGNTVTNVQLSYYPYAPGVVIYGEAFDTATAPALPGIWGAGGSGVYSNWVTQTGQYDSAPNSAFAAGSSGAGVSDLTSPAYALPVGPAQLTFRHSYNFETNAGLIALDGALVEIKIGTNAFVNLLTAGGKFIAGEYTHLISSGFGNPLAGQLAWGGNSGGFVTTVVDLPASVSGQNVQFRWRVGSDNGSPSVGWAVDSFAINARSCLCCSGGTNSPVLPGQTNRTVVELTPMAITNTATDLDLPDDGLFYHLSAGPAGANITSNGVILWTPSEAQGPGEYFFLTVATDSTGRIATNSFTVTVLETNAAPGLPTLNNLIINEQTSLVVSNTAVDPDLPANELTYTLLAAPAGAAVSSNGVITWNPDETQGPSFNVFTTRVEDKGSPNQAQTNTFSVTVNEVNLAPVLPVQPDRFVNELVPVVITNTAADVDLPFNSLIYQLINPPLGATINPGGIITWTPSDTQGPSTNLLVTVVTDNGVPARSATNTTQVVVYNTVTCQWTNLLDQNFDAVSPPGIPAGWTVASDGAQPLWLTQSAVRDSLPNAAFAGDAANVGNAYLISPVVNLSSDQALLTFRHSFNLEADTDAPYDGGVLEIKIGTNSFVDITNAGGVFLSGGYGRSISPAFQSPIAGRPAWSGVSGGFITTIVNLPLAAANQPVQLRWRCATDNGNGTAVVGWYVDSIVLSNRFCGTQAASPPMLPTQPDFQVSEGSLLSVTNSASDADLPGDFLAYQLVNPPAGMSVDAGGVIGWMPSEAQGAGTNLITTIVTDSIGLSDTNTFTIIVTEVNAAPIFVVTPAEQTVLEGGLLTVTNSASDLDVPVQTLVYSVNNGPVGLVIETNGVITWTPGEADGGTTNAIETVVTDGLVSVTNLFSVVVTEVNETPLFAVTPVEQTVLEGGLLTVTNSATDVDVPVQTLVYSVNNGPVGLVIETNGVITWTPGEADGGTTNAIETVVTDGVVSVTNLFSVVVTEVNVAPAFAVTPAEQTVAEGSLLTVTNSAGDSDLPVQTLVYSVNNAPVGLVIDPNGVITWTPGEADGGTTNLIETVVTDGLVSVTNLFSVVVAEVNAAPVLPGQTNLVVAELVEMVVTNTASDADLPGSGLTYQLVNPPGNAVIDTNGVISWTPQEDEAPGGYTLLTIASDGNATATNSFEVTVIEVNSAPALNPIASRIVHAGGAVVFNVAAVDSDVPGQQLSFSLENNPPAGASINPNSGLFEWGTSLADVNTTNVFTVRVADDGLPGLDDEQTAVIVVVECPRIENIAITNEVVAVTWTSIPGQTYRLQTASDPALATWEDLGADIVASGGVTTQTNAVSGAGAGFYRVRLAP
jgi:hypothetical protein